MLRFPVFVLTTAASAALSLANLVQVNVQHALFRTGLHFLSVYRFKLLKFLAC